VTSHSSYLFEFCYVMKSELPRWPNAYLVVERSLRVRKTGDPESSQRLKIGHMLLPRLAFTI